MKKHLITIAIVLGLGTASFAQNIFNRDGSSMKGNQDAGTPFLPKHSETTDQDGNEGPVGTGALLLIGFGAAYAMKRRREK